VVEIDSRIPDQKDSFVQACSMSEPG
jgi:hypothetical protein